MNKMVFLGWGLGSFTTSVLINSLGLLQLRFMTDSLGIGAAIAGTLIAISKIYDAATDPVMGVISDQTRSRWGRHRPYLFAGTILCALSLVMQFNVPAQAAGGWLIAYVAGVLLLFSTAYTMFRIPYLAMGAEITQGFQQRSTLMTFSVYGSSIGGLFATSAAPFLLSRIGSDRAGHGIIACILAGLILIGGLACFWAMGKAAITAPPTARRHVPFIERLRALQENRPFAVLIGFKMIMFTGIALHGTAVPFYTRHVLKASDASIAGIYLGQTLAMMASQFVWVRLARRFGRRNALIAAALLEALVMLSWTLVPLDQPTPWIQILGVCNGICSGGLFFGLYTILPDTMEYDRNRSGIEREGIFAGVFVMVEKITSALAAAVFGGVLGAVGYVATKDSGAVAQPAGVLQGIVLVLAILPSVAALLACLLLRLYDLDEAQVTTLEAARAASPA